MLRSHPIQTPRGPQRALPLAALLFLITAFAAGLPGTARAATDRYVATTGVNAGDCSNPAAPCLTIVYAISQSVDGDTIHLAAGTYTGEETTPGDGQGIQALVSLFFRGAGRDTTIVEAAAAPATATHRVFTLSSNRTLSLFDLTVRHGNAVCTGTSCQASGAAIRGFGGSFVDLRRVMVTANRTSCTGDGCSPLGVVTGVELRMTKTVVQANEVSCSAPTGDCRASGVVFNSGSPADMRMIESAVVGNVFRCVAANTCRFSGAVQDQSLSTQPSAYLNTTVASNTRTCTATTCFAFASGILLARGTSGAGRIDLTFLTVADNGDGPAISSSGTVNVTNSVFSGATAQCDATPIVAVGTNVATDNSCSGFTVKTAGAIDLQPLAVLAPDDTPVRPLGASSELTNLAVNCDDTLGNPQTTDQRGVARPQGTKCDVGAFEAEDNDGDDIPDVVDPDDDNDTIPDLTDACDFVPEDFDGFQDADGCPEQNFETGVPDTTIGIAPPAVTNDATPDFTYFGIDPVPGSGVASFVCKVTPGGVVPCGNTGPNGAVTLGPLADGLYTFAVAAVDGVGNTDPTPATHQFQVDATKPVVTAEVIDQATGQAYVSGTWVRGPVFVKFTCSDGADGSGIPSDETDTGSPEIGNTFPKQVTLAMSTVLGLDARWRCVDAAGNTADAPAGFPISAKVDRRDPTCKIKLSRTSVPRDGTPAAVTATVTGTDNEAGPLLLQMVSISAAPEAGGPSLPDASPGTWTLKGASGKQFRFVGRVTDQAGNTRECSAIVRSH
ncbi:MAG: choice-of-anchor Q domain-containing protein [Dehalococcoidia bacterium]